MQLFIPTKNSFRTLSAFEKMSGLLGRRDMILSRMYDVIRRQKIDINIPTASNGLSFTLSEIDFRSMLLGFPVVVNPDEIETLLRCYRKDRGHVDYKRFIEDLMSIQNPRPVQSPSKPPSPKVIALARYLHENGCDLLRLVSPYDKQNTGKVTFENFCRAMSCFRGARDVARIVVDLKTRLIDYRKLQNDCDMIDLHLPSPVRAAPVGGLPDCVVDLATRMQDRGIILENEFNRQQMSRSGKLDPSAFKTWLVDLKLGMTDEDLSNIVSYFLVDGHIDFNRFTTVMYNGLGTTGRVFPKPEVTPEDAEACKKKMMDAIASRRLNLLRSFEPYDEAQTGKVEKGVFTQVMIKLSFDLSDEQVNAVAESLADADGMVNYQELSNTIFAFKSARLHLDETIEMLLDKLRSFLVKNNMLLYKILSVFDREKSGKISIGQFAAAVRKVGFEVSEKDLALIRDNFEDPDTKHFMKWKDICDIVDTEDLRASNSHFSPRPHLEGNIDNSHMREVIRTPSSRSRELVTGEVSGLRTHREEKPVESHIVPLLGEIARALEDFGFDMGDDLIKRDKLKKGTVPTAVFRQVLALLPLKLQSDDVNEIMSFYKDPKSQEIDYQSFVRDVYNIGPKPSSSPRKVQFPDDPYTDAMPKRELPPEEPPVDCDIEPLLVRIRQTNFRTRGELQEYFRDFDRLKNGTVQAAKLASALSATGLHFSEQEMKMLCTVFKDNRRAEYVDYQRLLASVNNLKAETSGGGFGATPMTAEEQTKVAHVVRRLSEMLKRKRWTFARLFSGVPKGPISEDAFRDKIVLAGLTVKSDEWYVIMKKYRANPNGDVDWERFVKDSEDRSLF